MANTVVLDASVVVDALVNGRRLPDGLLAAPGHLDAEVLSALGRLHREGTLTASDVDEMLADLDALDVRRVPVQGLTRAAFVLRHNVARRDALFVTLARVVDGALCTADVRLQRVCADLGLCATV